MSSERFVLGVTGNIASGKSTACNTLRDLGAIVIDSDLVYRELVGPGQPLLETLVTEFGEGIRAEDGSLNRPALGNIVFNDPDALATLDRLTHPVIVAEVDHRVEQVTSKVVVLDAVKLIESGHADRCDQVWVVITNPETQIERLMARNSLSREEAIRRVNAQPSLEAKLARADLVIDNSGTLEETRNQVIRAWQALPIQER